MARTLRTSPTGTLVRDGKVEHSTRRPTTAVRRSGTRAAVIAAALAEAGL